MLTSIAFFTCDGSRCKNRLLLRDGQTQPYHEAMDNGWLIDADPDKHYCPDCAKAIKKADRAEAKEIIKAKVPAPEFCD